MAHGLQQPLPRGRLGACGGTGDGSGLGDGRGAGERIGLGARGALRLPLGAAGVEACAQQPGSETSRLQRQGMVATERGFRLHLQPGQAKGQQQMGLRDELAHGEGVEAMLGGWFRQAPGQGQSRQAQMGLKSRGLLSQKVLVQSTGVLRFRQPFVKFRQQEALLAGLWTDQGDLFAQGRLLIKVAQRQGQAQADVGVEGLAIEEGAAAGGSGLRRASGKQAIGQEQEVAGGAGLLGKQLLQDGNRFLLPTQASHHHGAVEVGFAAHEGHPLGLARREGGQIAQIDQLLHGLMGLERIDAQGFGMLASVARHGLPAGNRRRRIRKQQLPQHAAIHVGSGWQAEQGQGGGGDVEQGGRVGLGARPHRGTSQGKDAMGPVPAGLLLGAIIPEANATEAGARSTMVEAVIGEQKHICLTLHRPKELAEHAVLLAMNGLHHSAEEPMIASADVGLSRGGVGHGVVAGHINPFVEDHQGIPVIAASESQGKVVDGLGPFGGGADGLNQGLIG